MRPTAASPLSWRGPIFRSSPPTTDEAQPGGAMALTVGSIAYFGTYTVDEPSKTVLLKIEASTLPNQLGFEGKRVIAALTADELKFTNTTAVGDLGPVVTSHRRAE